MSGSPRRRPGTAMPSAVAEVGYRLVVAARRGRRDRAGHRARARSRGRRSRPSRHRPRTVTVPTTASTRGRRPSSPSVAPPGADACSTRPRHPACSSRRRSCVADVPAAEPGGAAADHVRAAAVGPAGGLDGRPAGVHGGRHRRRHPPAWFDALMWGNDAMSFEQEVVLLPDPRRGARGVPRAGDDRRRLPGVQPGEPGHRRRHLDRRAGDRGAGRVPVDRAGDHALRRGERDPGVPGHMLVGNTIVTWTAEALARRRAGTRRWPPWATRPACPRWSRTARSRPCSRSADGAAYAGRRAR